MKLIENYFEAIWALVVLTIIFSLMGFMVWCEFDLAKECVSSGMEWIGDSCIKKGKPDVYSKEQ